jgi:hypothetical protein
MTIDARGVLYIAANATGEVIRLDPATGNHCLIATGLQNPSSVKFGRGPGWPADRLYVTAFDGTVRELTPPAKPGGGGGGGGGPGGGGGTGGGPKTKDRIAVSVRPRGVAADARRRFHFTVYRVHAGKLTRLPRARVKLGGKTATTNRRGRAGLTLRFRRAGRKTVRATKSGLRSGTKAVRVRASQRD